MSDDRIYSFIRKKKGKSRISCHVKYDDKGNDDFHSIVNGFSNYFESIQQ